MRKNFLLLFLLTLLPLAGWAEGFDNASVKFAKFTYGDAAMPTVQVTDDIELKKDVHYTVDTKIYKEKTFVNEVTFAEMKANTLYYVKIFGYPGSVYEGYETYGVIDVKPAPLTLTVNGGTDLTKAYRAADPAVPAYAFKDPSQLKNGEKGKTIDKVVKGTLAYSYAGQPNADAADDIPLTFSGLSADNYEISYDPLNIDISAKSLGAPTITVTAQQGDVTYTGGVITPVYTVKDGDYTLVVGAGKDYTVACAEGDVKNVGTYTPTITGANNYTGTIVVAADKLKTFKVTKATLSIAAKNIEKDYKGEAYKDSDLAGDYDVEFYGLLGEDNAAGVKGDVEWVAPTFALQGTAKNVNAEGYIIKVTGGESKNYTFLQQNEGILAGKLTIKPVDLTVTADDKSRGIGQANPEFTYKATGMVGGEKAKDIITTNPTMTCEATTSSKAGTYDIVISGGAVNANYTLKYVNGTLTVGKSAITLTLLPAKKTFGDADPTWLGATGTPVKDVNYVVNGLMDGDALTNIHITRVAGENAGNFVMSATYDAPDAEKYTGVSVAPAQFTIEARPLTVTVLPQTLANGSDASKLVVSDETVDVEGLQGTDKVTDVVTLAFSASVVGTANVDYPDGIEASLKVGVKNYSFDNVKGRLVFGAGSAALVLDAADATNAETIELYNGQTKNVKIKLQRDGRNLGGERNWEAGNWVTMTLPFNITVADLSQALGYAIVNVINPEKTVVSGTKSEFYGKLTMKGGNGSDEYLVANKPFMVKISEDFADAIDLEKTINFGSQKIIAPADDAALTVDANYGVKFVGTYVAKTVTKNDNANIWFLLGNTAKWAYITSTSDKSWTIKPYEAFIDMSGASAPAHDMTFYFEELDGSTTAVKSINVDNLNGNKSVEGMYNLNGMKLNSVPTQKGVYIINGKKVVVK